MPGRVEVGGTGSGSRTFAPPWRSRKWAAHWQHRVGGDIADWWQRANARKERQSSQWLRRFAFLEPIVKDIPAEAQRRARATIAHLSDAQ